MASSKYQKLLVVVFGMLSSCSINQNNNNMGQMALVTSYTPHKQYHKPARKIVLVGGCFDVLHIGHVKFLEEAKKQGDYLLIALEPDVSITKYKKRQPIHTQQQRAEILSQLRCVDEVLLLPQLSGYEGYLQLVKDIGPQVIATTQGDPQLANKESQATLVGGRVAIVTPLIANLSSSKILKIID